MTPPPPALKRKGWPVLARYESQCSGCDQKIEIGDRIVLMSDDTYRHNPACEKIRK